MFIEKKSQKEIKPNFGKLAGAPPGIIPMAVQDVFSKKILMLGYVNQEALRLSLETGIATFWSSSRNELWVKGGTSGNTFGMVEILIDCENNSFVYLVCAKKGGICHTKDEKGENRESCFYRTISLNENNNLTKGGRK